jgi:hypothetical protein
VSSPLLSFVSATFQHHASTLNLKVDPSCAGAEVWVNSSDDPLEEMSFHLDKDEALLREAGEFAHPALATVTYLEAGIQVPTVVFGEEESLCVFPREGRQVAFAGALLHGCPGALRVREGGGGGRGRRGCGRRGGRP